MKNPYYYLFYKISKVINKKNNNEMGVMYALTLLITINFITIIGKIVDINESNYRNQNNRAILFIFIIVLFVSNYFIFIHNNRFKKILKLYINESKRSKLIGNTLVLTYIIVTFVILFYF